MNFLKNKKKDSSGVFFDENCARSSLLDRLQSVSNYPTSATISITERCHLFCPHCYISDTNKDAELSLDEISLLLDELAALGVLKLSITGGEPANRIDLIDIVKSAWKKKFLISLKTSASTLTFNDIKALRKNGLSKIDVSLYHIDPLKHDHFVGMKGAWQNTISCIEQFSSYGGIVVVGMVLMNWNAESVDSINELCQKKGWKFILDFRVTHKMNGNSDPLKFRVEQDVLQEASVHILNGFKLRVSKCLDDPLCNAGHSFVYFTSSGEARLCPSISVSMGNIREKSFKEIWDKSKLRKKILNTTWRKSLECMNCEFIDFCERCPGESFCEHGDYQKVNAIDCMAAKNKYNFFKKTNDK